MERKEIEKIYFKKINELKKFDKAYFDNDNPIISDGDYDYIKKEILNLFCLTKPLLSSVGFFACESL